MAKQTFTTGQVLTAAQMTSLQQTAMGGGSTTAKTASYTLVALDAGTVVQMNSATATTITVNTALFAAGDTVQIQNVGAGVCTVTAGSATVSTSATLALKQYDAGSLYFNTTSAAIFFAVDAADSTSPLTTKGDLYTYSTVDARLAVGTNKFVLGADSTQSTGLAWQASPQSTLTTTGDIIYASAANTPARLGIGTTGQVLNVSGGIPAWATASSGAITLIKARTTFTTVADTGTTFDNLFSSTYRTYLIIIDQFSSASAADAQLQLLYSGTTQSTANYYNAHQYITWGGAATAVGATAATSNNLGNMSAGANISDFTVKMYSPQASSTNWKWTWDGYSPSWQGVGVGGAFVNTSQSYTGIKLSASVGNITGAVTVYGLATS